MGTSKPEKPERNITRLQLLTLYMILYVTECARVKCELIWVNKSLYFYFYFQILKPKPGHLFVPSFFVLLELGSMRFSSDFAFLLRDLPASFKSSDSRFFSSSKSGLAIPSFSSLNLRTCSNISMASSTLHKLHPEDGSASEMYINSDLKWYLN